MSKLGLSALPAYEPITSYLDDQEWSEVFEAMGRGVPIKDILAKVGRYKTIRSFYRAIDNRRQKMKSQLYYRRNLNAKHNVEPQARPSRESQADPWAERPLGAAGDGRPDS